MTKDAARAPKARPAPARDADEPPPAKRRKPAPKSVKDKGKGRATSVEPRPAVKLSERRPVKADEAVRAVTAVLERLAEEAVAELKDGKEAEEARRTFATLLKKTVENLLAQKGRLLNLAADDIDDFADQDLDQLEAIKDAEHEAAAQFEDNLIGVMEQVEETRQDAEDLRQARLEHEKTEDAVVAAHIHPTALALFPLNDKEAPFPLVYKPWEDHWLDKLAKVLVPLLEEEKEGDDEGTESDATADE